MADISSFTVNSTDFNTGGGITISGSYGGGSSSDQNTNDEDIVLQVKLDDGTWVDLTGTWNWSFGNFTKTFSFQLDAASLTRLKDGSAISNLGNATFRFFDKEADNDGNNTPSPVNSSISGDLDGDSTTFTKAITSPSLASFNVNPANSPNNASDLNNSPNGITLRGAYTTTGTTDGTDDPQGSDFELYYKFGPNGTFVKVPATFTFSNGSFSAAISQANGYAIQEHSDVIFQIKQINTASGNPITVTETGSTQFTITCFYPGTMIATTEGEKAVETLAIGDMVLRQDGSAAPIRWMGRSTVSLRFADKMKALPIRIRKDALAENVPSRDLLVSPDHAIFIDGILAQAGALVNGTSIVREADVPTVFSYYHVELADHALIMAENTATESFVDNVDRMSFDNWAEHEALFGDLPAIAEMDLPRAKSQRQVPSATRRRLADRAVELGYSAIDAAVA